MTRTANKALRSAACLFALAAFFALPAGMFAAGGKPVPDPLLNKRAPQFVRNDLGNQPVDLAGLRGRVVLLNFWATWCVPCQMEIPRFIEWQSKYRQDGLAVVGVSMEDDPAPVHSLMDKRQVNYPVVMGDEKLGELYGGVLGLPVTYLIDRQGVVRARFKGETNLDAMEASIQKLLHSR